MLSDKDIANVALNDAKCSITDLTKACMESSGTLRQTLIQMRNECEQIQDSLAQLCISRGWYQPAATASQNDIQQIVSYYHSAAQEPALR